MHDQDAVVAGVTYINLDHRSDRRAHMEKQLAACPWPHRRFSAVRLDGPPEKLGIPMRKRLRGAVAVASIWQSHRGVLEEFLAAPRDAHFLLLEDDVRIAPGFWPALPALLAGLPEDWRLLMVSTRFRERAAPGVNGVGKNFVPPPQGPRPTLLKSLAATHHSTGAHCCVFRGKAGVNGILAEMAACREVHDVDVFYASLDGTYGLPDRRVGAGGFGSDHI